MYNKVVMIGNLTRDIELRYLPSGSAVAKAAVATSHKYKTQTGEQKDEVCYLDFSVFGKPAEILNQYVRKGSKVLLEGRLVLEQWTAQDGSKRSKHSLRVESFKFLDSKSDSNNMGGGMQQDNGYSNQIQSQPQYQGYNNAPQQGMMQEQKVPEIDVEDESIPF
jgi:single-strand DNA-binding protein